MAILAAGTLALGMPGLAHAHGQVLAGVSLPAARPGSAEAKLRAFETKALGAEHAAAHAQQRAFAAKLARSGGARQMSVSMASTPSDSVPVNVGGQWDPARAIPVIAINSILLPTGKVLMFAYPGRPGTPGYTDPESYNYANAYVWDPVTGNSVSVPPPLDPVTHKPTNIWCSGASFLPDGRVLVTGGNVDNPLSDFHGLNTVFVFDPFSRTWDKPPNGQMAQGRWYPSQLLTPDGRTMIVGGLTRPGNRDYGDVNHRTNSDLELFSPGASPADGTIETQSRFFNNPTGAQVSGLYPRMFWMPSGRALSVGPYRYDTWFVAPSSRGTPAAWSGVPTRATDREWGTAVQLSGGRVMMLGGSDSADADPNTPGVQRPGQSTTETFDENNPGAGWQASKPMAIGRSHANSVLLPDGKVATVGGGYGEDPSQTYYRWLYSDSQKRVELFDPATPAAAPVLGNAQAEARTYHSTALLLPDARVMSAGDDINGPGGPGTGTSSDTAEIYSPPYLFNPDGSRAPRPVIDAAPASVVSGGDLEVQASGPPPAKAVLVAPGAATHATDMSQRLVPLSAPVPVPGSPGHFTTTLPANVNLAPPGYYMLFLLSASGVPSEAKFVRVNPSSDSVAPVVTLTAPATGSSSTNASPTYSGAAGDLPSDRSATIVRVYAGSQATGTPVQTLAAPRSGTGWAVDGSPALAPGTYTAQAEQSDYAGNVGLSDVSTFTVLNPPPPPPPTPQPPQAPSKLSLKITGGLPRLRTVRRTKRFTITVQVSASANVSVSALLDRGRKPGRSLANARTVTFKAGGKRSVTFELTRAGRRLLAHLRHGVVRIRARAYFTSKRTLPVVQVLRTLR